MTQVTILTVRGTIEERERMKQQAWEAQLSLNEWARRRLIDDNGHAETAIMRPRQPAEAVTDYAAQNDDDAFDIFEAEP